MLAYPRFPRPQEFAARIAASRIERARPATATGRPAPANPGPRAAEETRLDDVDRLERLAVAVERRRAELAARESRLRSLTDSVDLLLGYRRGGPAAG